jgi:hypothetical protein
MVAAMKTAVRTNSHSRWEGTLAGMQLIDDEWNAPFQEPMRCCFPHGAYCGEGGACEQQ